MTFPFVWAVEHFDDDMLKDLCEINNIPWKAVLDYRAENYETRAIEDFDFDFDEVGEE